MMGFAGASSTVLLALLMTCSLLIDPAEGQSCHTTNAYDDATNEGACAQYLAMGVLSCDSNLQVGDYAGYCNLECGFDVFDYPHLYGLSQEVLTGLFTQPQLAPLMSAISSLAPPAPPPPIVPCTDLLTTVPNGDCAYYIGTVGLTCADHFCPTCPYAFHCESTCASELGHCEQQCLMPASTGGTSCQA